MKLVFIFSDMNAIQKQAEHGTVSTSLEIPDIVAWMPANNERIKILASSIAQLTKASLLISCKEFNLKNYPVHVRPDDKRLDFGFHDTIIRFYRSDRTHCQIRIVAPISSPYNYMYARSGVFPIQDTPGMGQQYRQYNKLVQDVVDNALVLLNSSSEPEWYFEGFHPGLLNKAALTRANKAARAAIAKENRKAKQAQKLAEKMKQKAEQGIVPPPVSEPRTGAGRTIGARPGIYKGVQMRSQLEIRFAAELDERGIRWIYEGESVSEAGYLVDFYLPDLGIWVEVKGRFEARDRQVLPEVAKYLKTNRKHRLLVYTGSGACMLVNPSGFREIERKNFWGELLK